MARKPKTTAVVFMKCRVLMNALMIEEFDRETGEPIIDNRMSYDKTPYSEKRIAKYKRNDIIALPEAVIKKLGNSVELVMAPVVLEPVEEVEEEAPKGELKPESNAENVAEMIPKVETK